jgi:hypothetical protein
MRLTAITVALVPVLLFTGIPRGEGVDALAATGRGSTFSACQFALGFATLQSLIPQQVGDCLDNESHDDVTGDALQHTTGGQLVWRRADNWTAFTDGFHTWIDGPLGLQERLNTERFAWEADAGTLPMSPNAATGIEGVVTLGPNAPTCLPGTPCSRPLAASVTVQDAAGRTVAQFMSGTDGMFRIDLSPGMYTLIPQRLNPNTNYPLPIPTTVTVPTSGYAQVEVRYDSLIR